MRAITTWVPGRGLAGFDRGLDEVFARFFGDEDVPLLRAEAAWMPAVESMMRGGEFVVRADLPGIDANAVDVSVEGNMLMIRGKREDKHEEKKGDRFYREVSYGSFARGVGLPPRIDPESVKAIYKDGVLEVTVKVLDQPGARKIPIATH